MAATWSRPANITQFARAAFDKKALGLLQTTWAGYSLDPKSFEQALPQYAAYVLAADAAWNADNPPDPASYPAGAYFLELMGLSTLSPANRGGWTADLRGAYNYPLAAADAAGWFALGPEHDLSMVPSGSVRWNGLAFQLGNAAEPGHPSVVALRSRLTQDASLPAAVEITVGAPAAHLVILNATNFACSAGTKVAEYELTYADGEKTKTDVRYGQQVLAYGDLSPAAEAPMVWSGRNRAGEPVAWRVFIWRNPHPEKVIRTLTARSANAPGALLILGLTGLDATRAGK